jgi:S1-C subfamily serine protease
MPLRVNNEIGNSILRSLVLVHCRLPYFIDGVMTDSYCGCGLILDAALGIVLVDQSTVPFAMADITIIFGASVKVPGSALYIHPVHNFALIQYDPNLLKFISEKEFVSAPLLPVELAQGDQVLVVGFTLKEQPFWEQTTVSKVEDLSIGESRPPRFRAINEQVIHLNNVMSSVGAVLVGSSGKVQAIWASYSTVNRRDSNQAAEILRGFPISLVMRTLEAFQRGEQPQLRSLKIEWERVPLTHARDVGVADSWVVTMEQQDKRHVLAVRRVAADADSHRFLSGGEILLACNSKTMSTYKEVEDELALSQGTVKLTVLKDEKEVEFDVQPEILSGRRTERIVIWAGAVLQDTHAAVAALGWAPQGVYCSRWHFGSPSHKYGIRASHWISELNGQQVTNLAQFLELAGKLESNSVVRLKLLGFQDEVQVITLQLDNHYWPTAIIERQNDWCIKEFS